MILLLGTSESGKSTLLKSIKLLAEGQYSLNERNEFKDTVFSNCLTSMMSLIQAMEDLDIPLENTEYLHLAEVHRTAGLVYDIKSMPAKLYAALKLLWADRGVQKAYSRRNEFQLLDCARYFLDDIDRITATTLPLPLRMCSCLASKVKN